jgi:hypothetical protein
VAGVDVAPLEDVAEEGAQALGLLAVEDGMKTRDHEEPPRPRR